MLDIKFIREHSDKVAQGARAKNVQVDIKQVLKLDEERRKMLATIEELRAEQNKLTVQIPKASAAEKKDLVAASSKLKGKIQELDEEYKKTDVEFDALLMSIPNPPASDVTVGKDDSENSVLRVWGKKPKFDFEAKDALTLGEALGIIDVERAAKVSGSRFGYLKGAGAMLEFALTRFAMTTAMSAGFVPVIPPTLVGERAMRGMGYLERGKDEVYHLGADGLYLVGTSEQSVVPMHMDEVFEERDLPKRYVSFSTCFRREAGSYGKDTRGILRVHQFDKIEMVSFTTPENGDAEHELFLSLEERLMQDLGIHHHVLNICSGDLGDPAARKYDIEAWIPSEQKFRETHSTSTTTDFQARRLNIRYKKNVGSKTEHQFVHIINGTAFAIGRMIVAILENFQEPDGSVRIPDVLVPYCGFDKITK